MSSEVLYRKWRPPRFADIIGQHPVTHTLSQAIATGRSSHAYLFCGPRGTGKTSTARVLAKALNCLNRPEGTGDPCGTCEACIAIEQGAFVDLIEIDAASNRGIDEIRDLREKVRFAPTHARFKVYIIDEAHALTNDAFNAFLKTLEEPPPHSVFILATTEPHRLPATIISRCQRFDFHRITPNDVIERLAEISESEGVDIEPEALRTIARAAGGSLRDATNLLDQVITSYGAHVTAEHVQELLGMVGEERALALAKHILSDNTAQALELINEAASEGMDLRPLHRMIVEFLRAALLLKSGVKDALELSKDTQSELAFLAGRVPMERILRALRVFGQVSLKYDQPSPLPLELAVVELSLDAEPSHASTLAVQHQPRAAASPTPTRPPQQAARQQQQPSRPAPAPQANHQPTPDDSETGNAEEPSVPANERPASPSRPAAASNGMRPASPEPAVEGPVGSLSEAWPAILKAMGRLPRRRFDVAALLRSSREHFVQGDELVVRFSHRSNGERLREELENPQSRLGAEDVLKRILGKTYVIRVESEEGTSLKRGDAPGHLVRAAMSFGGQVVPDTDEPDIPTEDPSHE